jgi:hypothetical protein
METVLGVSLVVVGGLIMGAGAWPMKLMRTFQFEHWWFLAMLFGLVLGPWAFTLVAFPNFFQVLCDPAVYKSLLVANILALCWGVANILCGICYVRIGIALTQAILSGLGVSVVVLTPMIFKAKGGQFEDAPDILSATGEMVLVGVGVMLIAVVFASLAGFGRDRQLQKLQRTSGSFLGGLIMTVIAGVTSAGLWLAFIYCEGPIQSRVCVVQNGGEIALTVRGNAALSGKYLVAPDGSITLKNAAKSPAATGSNDPIKVGGLRAKDAADKIAGVLNLPQTGNRPSVMLATHSVWAVFPVWAAGAFSGAMLNILYPAFLMTRRRSWGVLLKRWNEVGLSALIGIQFLAALALPGKGMLMLGALGAAIGGGIQQAMQMVGGQGTGFISGEWRGVHGKPRLQMYASIALLIVAAFIMAYSKTIKQ